VRVPRTIRARRPEKGIALLISIFVLLLISVVAIALIVSSGTETALAGNYRSSTGVYYAALAGLEEARGRLLAKDPNSFQKAAGFLPSPGTQLNIGEVRYVLNPSPTDGNVLVTYPDTEYDSEFGAGALTIAYTAGTVITTPSVWNKSPLNALPVSGPLYKWVRINGVSERSLNLDTCTYDTFVDPALVYYGAVPLCNPLSLSLNDQGIGAQVLELTALAVLPNGSQKLLQYLAAPTLVSLPSFPATLTFAGDNSGNSVAFSAPANNAGYYVKGIDQDSVGSCSPGTSVDAIGVFANGDKSKVINGSGGTIGMAGHQANYYGIINPGPDVVNVSGSFSSFQTPAQLEALAQTITQNADVIITPTGGPATGSNLPTTMYSPSPNPMTVVVNGDLDLNAWYHTGYGLLLVRGNLNYDPDASWDGIVLVIGQGTVTGTKGGGGEFDGAFLVANTRDSSGNILSNLGKASVIFGSNMGGEGIRYSSCWIQKSQPTSAYKILSFHEISQ
jgi:hypothetical protein